METITKLKKWIGWKLGIGWRPVRHWVDFSMFGLGGYPILHTTYYHVKTGERREHSSILVKRFPR